MAEKQKQPRTKQVHLLRVIDGDTVVVQRPGGWLSSHPKERLRLWGIDAPESDQTGGKDATKYLKRIIGSRRKIWMTTISTDQYGRTVAVIHPDRRTLENSYNYEMVRGGHAHTYMLDGPDQDRYEQAEAEAQEHRRGLWKRTKAQTPREFRVEQEEAKKRRGKLKWALIALATAAAVTVYLYLNSPAAG